ncbi:hypothetical protein K402DRAFT_324701 [Aulographum hederae CBS 113979]|uniref:Myb-like domain-containing protein n=1 Tax=Aulographum hederae CBS 113979 TaxID=1176131 RepID=A0A6G1HAY0_9PEZI|nr:hypothetical protein K402DRAFT_324701 [Aulographum hederae CBS 113979]
MHHHMNPQTISSPSQGDRHHQQFSSKGRKMSSTGGNRSWSEEEENYLLQTRMQKMPYKHIAAHLKKTELACRLHYHQLSHGSHRRKRTNSIGSSNSGGSGSSGTSPNTRYSVNYDHDQYGNAVAHYDSPNSYGDVSPNSRYSSSNSSPSRIHHKVLLPKPSPMSPNESPEQPIRGLRINTTGNMMPLPGSSVDTDRLRAIYDARRNNFWSDIAAEYGQDVSPQQLEEIWRYSGHPIARPPTPGDSPDGLNSTHPSLKPSPLPLYPSHSAIEPRNGGHYLSPIHQASAMSAPDHRVMSYGLPTPISTSSYATTPSLGGFSRTAPWQNQGAHPATSISALLTENKCPRPEYCHGSHCTHR